MRPPRIKFIWGGAERVPGHWHLGLWGTYEKQVGARRKVAVSVRGLLRWLAGAAVAAYLAGATAMFFWFDRRDNNIVTYTDTLLLPLRWSEVKEKRGRMMIEEGLADLRARRWSEAHMKLRVGLNRAPRELRGRLALAEFYLLSNRRTQALALLVEGLGDEYPGKQYLTTLFRVASQGEEFEPIIAAGERYANATEADRTWLLAQRVAALNQAGRHDEVLRLADAEGEAADAAVREARVLALVELGRNEEALAFLEHWERTIPGHRVHVVRLRVRALRELGRQAEMEAALEEFRSLAPADPRAYVYGIVQRWLGGEPEAADAALDDYFRRFSANPKNLMLAASAAGEAKALPLVRRSVERASAHGFRIGPMQLVLLQAEIAAGEWDAASATLAEAKRSLVKPESAETFALEWLERLLAVALASDGASEAMLLDFLRQRPMPLRVYRQTAEVLVEAGKPAAAQNVLGLAERSYGKSATLETLRGKVERLLAAQSVPEREAPARAEKPSIDAGAFFRSLAEMEAEKQWADAARAVREVRLAKPGWLAAREREVLEAQMRITTHTGEVLEMLGAAKLYLDGDVNRALRVVGLARELGAAGRRDEGELLLKEVLRKHADFPPVLRLRKEWAPEEEGEAATGQRSTK